MSLERDRELEKIVERAVSRVKERWTAETEERKRLDKAAAAAWLESLGKKGRKKLHRLTIEYIEWYYGPSLKARIFRTWRKLTFPFRYAWWLVRYAWWYIKQRRGNDHIEVVFEKRKENQT